MPEPDKLADAIAELKIGTDRVWKGKDIAIDADDPVPIDHAIATILNAVLSGDLIPLAHHNTMIGASSEAAAKKLEAWGRNLLNAGKGDAAYYADMSAVIVRALIPADARAALDEAISRARKDGWKACIAHLMQGGSRTGCDFHNEVGQVTGRFHGFFPAGATHDERAAHYEDLAAMERASKDAKPLDFGELKWVDAALAPVEGAKA